MIINEAGEYTLQYTATDACGNTTTVERELTVEGPPRTVLYTDGTFIINEAPADKAANEELHGVATNVYAPFNPNGSTNNDKYIFGSSTPWQGEMANVISVEIGEAISPTNTHIWFSGMTNLATADLSNLDTRNVTNMSSMFEGCSNLSAIDLSHFNTGSVENFGSMFYECTKLTELDLSSFNTITATRSDYMFSDCQILETIYTSNSFDLSNVTASSSMFNRCYILTGGAGTAYNGNNPKDKTYARIDNPPDAPGYFTARS